MRLLTFCTLVAILSPSVATDLVPRGNCCTSGRTRGRAGGSTGTVTRGHNGLGTGRLPRGVDREVIERELPVMDMNGFVERFHNNLHRAVAHGGRHIVGQESETQEVTLDRLGNRPFAFIISVGQGGHGSVAISTRINGMNSLVERFREVNHHVTVHRYQLEWELRSYHVNQEPHVIPVSEGQPFDTMGPQICFYERGTPTHPITIYRPQNPAFFDLSLFTGPNHPYDEVTIHWKVTVEYER